MMQVLAGIFLAVGVGLCFASSCLNKQGVRADMVIWGLLIYTAGHGILWIDHLIPRPSNEGNGAEKN